MLGSMFRDDLKAALARAEVLEKTLQRSEQEAAASEAELGALKKQLRAQPSTSAWRGW